MAGAFGAFAFAADEYPQRGTYSGWQTRPSYTEQTPLGANKTDVILMALGSSVLSFESVLTQARFNSIAALLGTVGTFTDFDTSPNSRSALLRNVNVLRWISNDDLTTSRKVRVRFDFIEQ